MSDARWPRKSFMPAICPNTSTAGGYPIPPHGAGAILDLTVHETDLLRFILDDEPEAISTLSQNGGLAAEGIEDAALSLIRFRSGLLANLFEGFTTRYVETGVEVHGTEGSLVARDCMSQTPRGTLVLRTARGEEQISLDHQNYYARGVRAFHELRGVERISEAEFLRTVLVVVESKRLDKAILHAEHGIGIEVLVAGDEDVRGHRLEARSADDEVNMCRPHRVAAERHQHPADRPVGRDRV